VYPVDRLIALSAANYVTRVPSNSQRNTRIACLKQPKSPFFQP
jgi:hypothetical protein